jgi:hypothetical protein
MARVMPANHSPAVVIRAPRSMSLAVRDTQRVQREQTPTSISQNQPSTTPYPFSTQDHRRPYHPRFPKSQRHSNPRRVRKTAYLSHRKGLVGASALESGLMSRITNDMLLGGIAASTGLWVVGISVTVSYLVITA